MLSAPALAIVVASVLSACTTAQPDPRPTPPRTATASPSPQVASLFDVERFTTATGTLTGAVHGSVRITSPSEHRFTIEITTTAISGTRDRAVTLATSLGDTDCVNTNDSDRPRAIAFGEQRIDRSTLIEGPSTTNSRGDISYLEVLVLTDEDHRCDPSTAGVARLRWTRDPELSALKASDSGPMPRAEGEVTVRAGAPVAYTVAPGDDFTAVSKRFGLTPDEILYLNPRRFRGNTPQLFFDEVLNLDSSRR